MWQTKQLILHGSIILLGGLLAGAGFGRAIVRGKAEDVVRAWRVAHSGLVTGGALLLLMGLVVERLRLPPLGLALFVWTFVVSSYGFAIALPLGAHTGNRGLTFTPPLLNRIVYIGNIVGAAGSLIGTLILLWGAWAAACEK